jgi:hypothetical protein
MSFSVESFARAMRTAGAEMPARGSDGTREDSLERTLRKGLAAAGISESLIGARRLKVTDDWSPLPGALDLYLTTEPGGEALVWAAELKVDHLDQTLWDLFKLTSLSGRSGLEATFLVVAADSREFSRPARCAELFPPLDAGPREIDVLELFRANAGAWCDLLYDGTGRPTRLPRLIKVSPFAQEPLANWPGYELRGVSVDPAPGKPLPMADDGWPQDLPPSERRCPERRSYIDCCGYFVPRMIADDKRDGWVNAHVPKLTPAQQAKLRTLLLAQGWDEAEVERAVP